MGARETITYFAELARPQEAPLDVTARKSDAAWLGTSNSWRGSDAATRLRSIDRLHRDESILRIGWHVLVGRRNDRKVFLPLLSAVCHLERLGGIEVAGEVVYTQLPWTVSDFEEPWNLTDDEILAIAIAIGLEPDGVVGVSDPTKLRGSDELHLVRGSLLYAARDRVQLSNTALLNEIAVRPDLDSTAVAAIYGHHLRPQPGEPVDPVSTVRLSAAQREVVRRSQTEPLTVVSGAPGTGKTLTLASAAMTAATQGTPTLVVTSSIHTADVLAEFLSELPGVEPVRFGDPKRRWKLANDLLAGEETDARDEAGLVDRVDRLQDRRTRLERVATDQLHGLQRLTTAIDLSADLKGAGGDMPNVGSPDFDPHRTLRLVERVLDDAITSRLVRWFDRRKLRSITRRDLPHDRLADLRDLLDAECTIRDLPRLDTEHMLETWDSLCEVTSEEHAAALDLSKSSAKQLRRKQAKQAGQLAAALQSTSSMRQLMLASLDAERLFEALPLWVGTLSECEQVLPRNSAPFDLVIIDEASQVAQPDIVGALSRARRAVVCGDPHQLRHVSFISAEQMAEAAERAGIETEPLHDVRSNSAFDAAAAAVTPIRLAEHFRSAPHLIGFNARRFYDDKLHVMTIRPANSDADRIHTQRINSTSKDRVDPIEISAAIDLAANLGRAGYDSIGLVSPFRAVADALEAVALDQWTAAELDSLGLRLGTVHSFQGSERDVVIAVLGVEAEPTSSGLRWVQQDDLFNVMTTRARQHLHIVSRAKPEALPPGVLRDYLRWGESTSDVTQTSEVDRWSGTLADALEQLGHHTQRGYRVGPWIVDVVLPDAGDAVGIEATLDPAGVEATLARRRILTDLGWRIVPAHQASWTDQPTDAALHIASRIGAFRVGQQHNSA
ncbi:MAG: AAA family ATPase [Actinomycetia bacterium]|nr:AAA family ATPase [Actinomycetes bacterium]